MATALGSPVCRLAEARCSTASAPGFCVRALLPAHHLHTSSEMGKPARRKKRAIFIPLPHMEAVPSLSYKYRDRAKKVSVLP